MSLEQEIHESIKQITDTSFNQYLGKIDHYVYGVKSGDRVPMVKEFMRTTAYRPVANYRDPDTGDIYTFLIYNREHPHLLVRECMQNTGTIWADLMMHKPRIFQIGLVSRDLKALVRIQEKNGLTFNKFIESGGKSSATTWCQADHSQYTRDITCYVEYHGNRQSCYLDGHYEKILLEQELMESMDEIDNRDAGSFYEQIGPIDHTAYRVKENDIAECARDIYVRTGYKYSESYLVETENARTIVFRRGEEIPAVVASFGFTKDSVVTGYVEKYGPRVHHTAYKVTDIYEVVKLQQQQKLEFTTDSVVGDRDKGLLQIFTKPSSHSLEIFEYIERFKGFRGFFLADNVGALMQSTKIFN